MFHSLRFRLLFMMALLLTMSVSVVAVLAREVTTRQFYRYVEYDNATQLERFASVLSTYYNQELSWGDVQPLVEQMASITGARIALVDNEGDVIATSSDDLVGRNLEISGDDYVEIKFRVMNGRERDLLLMDERMLRGSSVTSVSAQMMVGDGTYNEQVSFVSSVTRTLLFGVIIACIVAMGLTEMFSRRMFASISKLTQAAKRMEKGDLNQRVDSNTKDEVGQLGSAFNAMADGLATLERTRRNMVSDIAHELRTPLSNIRGYLEAIQDGVLKPSRKIVDSLYEESMLLQHLVEDLQELALAESGQLRLTLQPVALKDVLQRMVETLRVTNHEVKDLDISADLASDLPLVEADVERVGQIVQNLLNNAITHTPNGGKIRLTANKTADEVKISVMDNGEGISSEHLNNVFERFYRVDRSRSRKTGGAGLGLAIARQLIQAHGGRIWVESVPGQGSTFTFTLPLCS